MNAIPVMDRTGVRDDVSDTDRPGPGFRNRVPDRESP